MSSLPPPPPPPPGGSLPQPPPASAAAAAYGAPQPGLSQPPAKSGMSGCAIAAIVAVVLIVLGGAGVLVLGVFVLGKAADKIEDNVTARDCPVLSNSKAKDLFGDERRSHDDPIGKSDRFAFDNRVLRDSDSCWVRTPTTRP